MSVRFAHVLCQLCPNQKIVIPSNARDLLFPRVTESRSLAGLVMTALLWALRRLARTG